MATQTTGYLLLGLDRGHRGPEETAPWRVLARQPEGWDSAPLWHEGERQKAAGEILDYAVVHVSHVLRGGRLSPRAGFLGVVVGA